MKVALYSPSNVLIYSTEDTAPTSYISFLPAYAHLLKENKRGVIFVSKTFLIGILGSSDLVNIEELKTTLEGKIKSSDVKTEVSFTNSSKEKKSKAEKIVTKDIVSFKILSEGLDTEAVKGFLQSKGCEIAE